jgi:lactoylglutathione lyase
MPTNARALHWVFKIGSRTKTIDFYLNILNMKILRHEEFEEGCDAACNGPYDGKWSKTMIGYGEEDNNFVVELTYNYGIRNYQVGNDFKYLSVKSNQVIENIKTKNYTHLIRPDGSFEISDPNGYKFLIFSQNETSDQQVVGITLSCSNIQNSINYWSNTLKAQVAPNQTETNVSFSFDKTLFRLNLELSLETIDHAKGK